MKNIKLLCTCFLCLSIQASMFSQTINITESGAFIDAYTSCDDYVDNMNKGWIINIPGNKSIFLDYFVDVEEGYDNVTIYSFNDNTNMYEYQTTLTGSGPSGVIQSLYPNGKMFVLFTTDGSVNCDEGYAGMYMNVYAGAKISYSYDAAGNRTSRTILFENNSSLRSAMNGNETAEETIYEDKVEYPSKIGIQEANILIYPNPTQGQLAVEIRNIEEETTGDIYLTSNSGQLIEKKTIASDRKIDFDLSNQPPGIYLINIRIDKAVTTWKIIKK